MLAPAEGSMGLCPTARRVPTGTTTSLTARAWPRAHLAGLVGTTQSARMSYAYCVHYYAYCVSLSIAKSHRPFGRALGRFSRGRKPLLERGAGSGYRPVTSTSARMNSYDVIALLGRSGANPL